jgi:hypothetical protein
MPAKGVRSVGDNVYGFSSADVEDAPDADGEACKKQEISGEFDEEIECGV